MLTTLFWCAYFLFSLVWAVATGVVFLVCWCISMKYPYSYYHAEFRGLPKKLIWLKPLLEDFHSIPYGLHWCVLNIPIIGGVLAGRVVFNHIIVPCVLTPITQRVTAWVISLISPYLE